MRLTPANLISGSYSDDALSWAAMRTVNWLPEVAEVEGTRTVKKLATPPGLSLLVDLGTRAPVRGIADVEGRLFAVSGDSLFEVSNDLAVTNRGSIPGVGRVSMAHNKQGGSSAANELAIANGLSGYVYNTDSTVLAQITDSAFEGASTFDYVDGYMSYTDPQGRWWGHSDLNQATQYSSIDRNDAESAPDPIISHIVSHREVIVWGTRTGEFFRNTGAATGTFQRVDGTEMEVGICSTFARARVDNTVCWVGNDLTVYRLNGHAPQRISTRPIEQALSRVDPANVFCFAWEDRGHKVFYITSPGDFTLGFDFSSGIWHERQSYGLDRWRVNCLARWGNRWIAGDYANGLLYELDWDAYMEHGLPMVSTTTSGYTTADQNKVLCPYAELIFDTGGHESESETISDPLWLDVLSLLQDPQAVAPIDAKPPMWGYLNVLPTQRPTLEVGNGPFGENCLRFTNLGSGNSSILFTATETNGQTAAALVSPLRANYTVEAFVNPDSVVGTEVLFALGASGLTDLEVRRVGNSYALSTTSGGANLIIGGTAEAGAWQHVAITRSAGVVALFVNGVSIGTTPRPEELGSVFTYGSSANTNNPFNGMLAMMRITGIARYTANFTVPTRLFPEG